jgi:hypothetical protein
MTHQQFEKWELRSTEGREALPVADNKGHIKSHTKKLNTEGASQISLTCVSTYFKKLLNHVANRVSRVGSLRLKGFGKYCRTQTSKTSNEIVKGLLPARATRPHTGEAIVRNLY